MAILVSTHNLKKTFASRPLFEGLTFSIESGERIGLIGPNGAGKSTLLKIIAGITTADEGTFSKQKGLRVGYLEQSPAFASDATILSTVLEGTHDPDDWESIVLAEEFIAKLSLNINGLSAETPVAKLSGGWKKRVALARELARKPDILLLDEPTNHLDVESILWLEDLLSRANFTTLTVTHDRLFLQRIANRILELDKRNPGGLLSINGDYTAYLETKGQLMAAQERREIILKNTLRRETEWLRRGARARQTKQTARINRAGELKDEVGELGYRNQARVAKLEFASAEKNPKRLIDAVNISKAYDDQKLFSNLDLLLKPGSRIGLLGTNGCGKSTLIRVLLGLEDADTGEVTRADGLTISYFEQNRETLDPDLTVSDTLCPRGDHVEYRGGRMHIRGYLDRFLFTQEQMDMPVGKLSGGEQSRLLIARLMLKTANILVLDEPTNDLDMATLSVLEECLTEFNGAVLLVTHDRYFLDQVATQIIAFPSSRTGKLVSFANLEQWEAWHANQESDGPLAKPTEKAKPAAAASSGKKKKLSFNEQREYDSMEKTIHETEASLAKLSAESALPENAANASRLNELAKGMADLQNKIDRLYARWAELE